MSEYQFYEFLAIDRPLGREDMAALRRITSRAEITPTHLSNTYNFGSFKGDPRALMRRYFDAMVYITNWGTRQLMLKLPRGAVNPEEIKLYCVEGALEMEVGKDHVLLDFQHDEDEGDAWLEDREAQGWLSSLALLRAELMRGEHASLYLAWLHGASQSFEEGEEDRVEPPVPHGLSELSAPCQALSDFFAMDEDRIDVASETSKEAKAPEDFAAGLRSWLKKVSAADKEAWLVRLASGAGAGVEGEIVRRFHVERPRRSARGEATKRRTLAEILARAEVLAKERDEREEKAAARAEAKAARALASAQEKRIAALAEDEGGAWRAIAQHVASKNVERYDQAVVILSDLEALAARRGETEAFVSKLRGLKERSASKQAFVRRVREKGIGEVRLKRP